MLSLWYRSAADEKLMCLPLADTWTPAGLEVATVGLELEAPSAVEPPGNESDMAAHLNVALATTSEDGRPQPKGLDAAQPLPRIPPGFGPPIGGVTEGGEGKEGKGGWSAAQMQVSSLDLVSQKCLIDCFCEETDPLPPPPPWGQMPLTPYSCIHSRGWHYRILNMQCMVR